MVKKGIIKTFLGAIGAGSVIALTGCPDVNKAPIVKPVESPIKATEGLPFSTIFDVYDDHSTLEQLIIEAEAQGFEDIETEKMPSNQAKVTGKPIDPNRSGPFDTKVKVTDLEGKSTTVVVPGVIEDTIDTTFFDLPEKIYATKGLPTSTFISKVLDDYSRFNGQGLTLSIVSPDYIPEINYFTDGYSFSWRLIPKNTSIEPTHADFIVSDDEGNTKTVRVAIERMGLINHPPIIGEVPDVQTKEGQGGEFSLDVNDDHTPFDELLMYATSDDFHTALQALNGTVKIIYNPKDLNDNGLKKIKFTTIDGDGASSYKDIYVTISPMTDMEFNVLGQNLIIGDVDGADDVVVGHNTVPLANAAVRVYKREINWVEKEEYGDLYHFRMGVNSNLGELLFQGKTDTQGNLKLKVDPLEKDKSLLYLVVENAGFYSEIRHYFGNEDIGKQIITLPSKNEDVKNWLYYVMCNNGFQPMAGDAYISKSNVSWPHTVFPNTDTPNFVLLIENGEYVSPDVVNEAKNAIKEAFGNDIEITYDTSMKPPYSNKFFIEFIDGPNGNASVVLKPLSNLIDYAVIRVGREYSDKNFMIYVITHETNHAKKPGSHYLVEDFDSNFGGSLNFSTYPYLTGLDKAMLEITNKMYPGDKFIFENGKLIKKSFSVIDFSNEKIYYLIYVEK